MNRGMKTRLGKRGVARGMTLVEAAISTVVVGVMLVAALNTVGAARTGEYKYARGRRGLMLAQELMTEILQQRYSEEATGNGKGMRVAKVLESGDGQVAVATAGAMLGGGDGEGEGGLGGGLGGGGGLDGIGTDSGESDGTRAQFDDIDDYHGWTASPPQDKAGTVMNDLQGWERQVRVGWVNYTDPMETLTADKGVKRIQVTVLYDGVPVASLESLRTSAWPMLGGSVGEVTDDEE